MEIPMGESIWATRSLLYMWHIHMRRVWSLAKHSAPPEPLAELLAPRAATRDRRAQQLKTEHRNFLLLERRVHQVADAARLREHIIFLDADAVRIIFEFYARDCYESTSRCGQESLLGHIYSLPDNKIVEDVHQPLRMNARGNVNKKLAARTIQNTIVKSKVLQKRGIPHHCDVDKHTGVKNFRQRYKTCRAKHRAHLTKIASYWSRLMKLRKTWHTQ